MEIKKLNLRNVRGLEEQSIEFDDITAIMGPTGSGKTTVVRALESALAHTSKKDITMMSNNARTMEIDLDLEDGNNLKVTSSKNSAGGVTSKVAINGTATTFDAASEFLENTFGIKKEAALRAISQSEMKNSLTDIGPFLLSYIPEQLNVAKVKSFIKAPRKEVLDEIDMIFPAMPDTFSLDEVKRIHEDVKASRKNVGKKVEVLKSSTAQYEQENQIDHLVELEKHGLSSFEADRENVLQELGKASAMEQLHKQWLSETQRKEALQVEISALTNQLSGLENVRKPDEEEKEALAMALEKKKEEKYNASATLSTLRENIDAFKRSLSSDRITCPITGCLCSTDASEFKKELADLIRANEEGAAYQETLIQKLEGEIESLAKDVKEWQDLANAYQEKLSLIKKIEERKKAIPTIGPEPMVIGDSVLLSQKSKLDDDIKSLSQFLEYKEDKKKLARMESRLSVLKELCDMMNTKGDIMVGIHDHYIGMFNKILEERSALLDCGMTVLLKNENGIRAEIHSKGQTKDIKDASSGETALAMFLMADMLNQLTGSRIIVLDDVDKLDEGMFSKLAKFIKQVKSEYDNIIILGINHEDTMAMLKKEGVTVHELSA
ncbi:MAG: AAA family ATPase [Eubacterium sp.]|nr:AAA family ATPase [Eubacterium sp.]